MALITYNRNSDVIYAECWFQPSLWPWFNKVLINIGDIIDM